MIRLILKYLDKIKQFFLIIPILIGIMVFTGLFFAHEKSEPIFASKADKVMFDVKDKSPKYVMTLPEEEKGTTEAETPVSAATSVPEQTKTEPEERILTNEEKLNLLNIPFLTTLPNRDKVTPLAHIYPFPEVQEKNEQGLMLPIKKGTLVPWNIYGQKTNVMPMFSKVAIIIKNVGRNSANTGLIIERLPAEVSLSFSPYTTSLGEFVARAREWGHETYLDMILPSRDVSRTDFGPQALNFYKDVEQNIEILEKQLSQNIAVGGFVVRDGMDDEEYNQHLLSIMAMLEKRGLLMLDATHGSNVAKNNVSGLDRARADIVIDGDFNRQMIGEKLEKAEARALKKGSVIVVADAKPVVILALYEWLSTFSQQLSYEEMKEKEIHHFEKPLVLVPLSNLVGEY